MQSKKICHFSGQSKISSNISELILVKHSICTNLKQRLNTEAHNNNGRTFVELWIFIHKIHLKFILAIEIIEFNIYLVKHYSSKGLRRFEINESN